MFIFIYSPKGVVELVKVKLQVILKMAHQKVGEMFGGAYQCLAVCLQ